MRIERRDAPRQLRRAFPFAEIKLAGAESDAGTFEGYGAIFGNEDAYGDVIRKGAFAQTLEEWAARGKWPPMLSQHGGWGVGADDMTPVGAWTDMAENSRGLKVKGRLFALDTERGRYLHEGLKSGTLDGLSIGFVTREMIINTDPDEPARILTNIDLWEVSIVTFPANPEARVLSVKSLTPDQLRDLEDRLREAGLSRSDAVTAIAVLKRLQREAGAPTSGRREVAAPAISQEEQALIETIRRTTGSLYAGALAR